MLLGRRSFRLIGLHILAGLHAWNSPEIKSLYANLHHGDGGPEVSSETVDDVAQ